MVVIDVLFRSGLGGVAVGWQVWVSLMMSGVLFREGVDMNAVGWQGWVALMMRACCAGKCLMWLS